MVAAPMEPHRIFPIQQLADPAAAWSRLREICCATALSGSPLPDRGRWSFFGELWVGPYQCYLPDWTYVNVDQQGRVQGYITLCPDSRRLERKLNFLFRPGLALALAFKRYPMTTDARNFLKRWLGLQPSPESRFPREVWGRVHREFPAHLHMNLESGARGTGAGRALCESALERLRQAGVPGIHLLCGDAPVGFYSKNGFEILHAVEWKPGVRVNLMVRNLGSDSMSATQSP
jgi:GNAT superfamily N-acetyltransferase